MRMATSEIVGCVEQPLLSAEQIVPGVFITGLGFTNVWEVLSVEGRHVHMAKVTFPATPRCTGETHSFGAGAAARECQVCGYRIHNMSGLLSKQPDAARSVVLTPTGPLIVPDKYTVYVTAQGAGLNFSGNLWEHDMPIFPEVCAIWSVPEELRALLDEAHG